MSTTLHVDAATGEVTRQTSGPNPDTGELYDGSTYELPIPRKDGHRADNLKVAFGGSVDLELMDEAALAYFTGLKLLTDVTFTVTATVVGNGWKASRNSEDEENVVNTVQVKVHSLDLPEQTS